MPANFGVSDPASRHAAFATSCDAFLGERLTIRQPVKGHRAGSDAILLAAAAPATGVARLVDVGAGVGAVGLAILQRLSEASADLIESDRDMAELARENAARNDMAQRTRIVCLDIADAKARRAAGVADEGADLVVTNPPFYEAGGFRISPDKKKASAHAFGGEASLEAWILASLALLRPGGCFRHDPPARRAVAHSWRIRATPRGDRHIARFTRKRRRRRTGC